MTLKPLLTKFQALAAGLLLLLVVQGCNKEVEQLAPDANAAIQDCGTTTPTPTPTDFCKQVSLVSGHTVVGTVSVAMRSTGDALVTYAITAPGVYLTEANLDVFSSLTQLRSAGKVTSWGAFPSLFAFDEFWSSRSQVRTYTFVVPHRYISQCTSSTCFFITAQARLSNNATAWAGLTTTTSSGVTLDPTKQFTNCSGSAYFEFCKTECTPTIDFTYAWEDLIGSANDSDYNDLVVQSDITKSATELKINFLLTARGASFDHKFQFNIPKAGITGIYGASSYVDHGTYYTVTVFENDRLAFANGGYVNASGGAPCTPFAEKEVTLTLNSSFVYNAARPYEPFISVYYAGDPNPAYDLYIYEVSHRDTWTSTAGKVYPNGILIPADWRWPLESINITVPYPNFTSLTDGFTPTWANTLADPSKTFDKSICNL